MGALSDSLQKFLNDPSTLYQRIQHQNDLYTKVDAAVINGVQYVTTRVNSHDEATHLQLFTQNRRKLWCRIGTYYLKGATFQIHCVRAIEDIWDIIDDYA